MVFFLSPFAQVYVESDGGSSPGRKSDFGPGTRGWSPGGDWL